MGFARKLAQFGLLAAALLAEKAVAQNGTPSLNNDDGKNHIFHHKNMHVVLMRDAHFGFTTEPQDSAKRSQVIASGTLHHPGGHPVGGQKNYSEVQSKIADPAGFPNTNFGTNNWVFHKNGITGNFDAMSYGASPHAIEQAPGSVGQSGLMALDNGVNVAKKDSKNREERIGLFGNNRDIVIIKCDDCTVYEMGQAALEIGATEGGILTSGKGKTGFTANTGDALVKDGQAQSTYKLLVRSDLNTCVVH